MSFPNDAQEMAPQTPEVQANMIDITADPIAPPEPNYVAMEAEEDEVMEDTDEVYKTLPLSKVKRIFRIDPEYSGATASAAYATAMATELFVQYLAEQSAMIAKTERRKKIQYKDVSTAANSQDALYFLSDAIPRTQAIGDAIKQKRVNISVQDQHKLSAPKNAENANATDAVVEVIDAAVPAVSELPEGQSTLPFVAVSDTQVKKAGLLDLISNDEPIIID